KEQCNFLSQLQPGILLAVLIFSLHLPAFGQIDQLRDKLPHSDELMIVAHRASHQYHPENSLEAIQAAIDMEVDIIEIDVRVATDGTVYLMHVQTIDRTTTGSADIETTSSYALRQHNLLFDGEDS